jgi:hypothetical protein
VGFSCHRGLLLFGGRPFLLALALAGCTKSSKEVEVVPTGSLVGEVKRLLAERDQRLSSYRIVVDIVEGEHRAHHEFTYRSPNKSRGHLTQPQEVEIAFDGKQLVRVLYPAKVVEPIPLDFPPAERAFFLARTFMPFAPEGYRAPLLPMTGVEAKRVTLPNAPEAVEVTVHPAKDVEVVYLLRLPSGDFLGKRTKSEGEERVLTVVKEQCDEKLKLCVPLELLETVRGADGGEAAVSSTRVSKAELNVEVAADFFSPR